MDFKQLTPEQIAQLNTETGGPSYAKVLQGFVDAGIAGADLSNEFPGKTLKTVASGLKNAQRKSSAFNNVRVVHTNQNGVEVLALIAG